MSVLIVCFDGTDNEPEDARTIVEDGAARDVSITNVVKLHLMAGGDLRGRVDTAWPDADQKVIYFHGIGTWGSKFRRLINAALAPDDEDVAVVLRDATVAFDEHYAPGDQMLLIGFSRGAATARRFASIIAKRTTERLGDVPPFIYLAVFDTVASFGLPDFDRDNRPKSEVLFENGRSLAPQVAKALHMVSLDERRGPFQPTLMNRQRGVVEEVWFAGVHSDVGGGFLKDGLSDVTLRHSLDWIARELPQVRFDAPSPHMLGAALPEGADYVISAADVAVAPNPFGKSHASGNWFTDLAGATEDRICCVIQDDEPTSVPPLLHWSLAARIRGELEYRPDPLEQISFEVLPMQAGDSIEVFSGYNALLPPGLR